MVFLAGVPFLAIATALMVSDRVRSQPLILDPLILDIVLDGAQRCYGE